MNKQISRYLAEGLLIVFSVLFALFINKLAEQSQINRKRNIALERINKEIEKNLKLVQSWKKRHQGMEENIIKLVNPPFDSLAPSFQDKRYVILAMFLNSESFFNDFFQTTSWETAQSTGIVEAFDYESTEMITHLYNIQKLVADKTVLKITDKLITVIKAEPLVVEKNLVEFQMLFRELLAQEEFLIITYQNILKELSTLH